MPSTPQHCLRSRWTLPPQTNWWVLPSKKVGNNWYRVIRQLGHGRKLFEKGLEERLTTLIKVDDTVDLAQEDQQ